MLEGFKDLFKDTVYPRFRVRKYTLKNGKVYFEAQKHWYNEYYSRITKENYLTKEAALLAIADYVGREICKAETVYEGDGNDAKKQT